MNQVLEITPFFQKSAAASQAAAVIGCAAAADRSTEPGAMTLD
jgi:hypothetical protein